MTKPRRPNRDSAARVTPLVGEDASALQLARALCSVSTDAMLLTNAAGMVVHANPAAVALFAPGDGELCGRDLRVLVPGCPSELRYEGRVHTWTTRVLVPADGLVELDVRLRALDPPRHSVLALVATPRPGAAGVEMRRWALAAQGSTDGFWHRPEVGVDAAWWSPRLYEMLGHAPGEVESSDSSLGKRLHPGDRESEARFKALVDNAPFEIFLKDRDGRYVLANARAAAAWRLPVAAIIGRTAHELFEAEIADPAGREDDEILEKREPIAREFVAQRHGRRVELARVKFPIPDAQGNTAAIAAITHDITERNQTLRALEASERRFRDFADMAADYLWETDRDLRFTFISERCVAVDGTSADELMGKRLYEAFDDRYDDDDTRNAYLESLQAHRPSQVELTRIRPDNNSIRLFISAMPILDASGAFDGLRGITRDVTQAHELAARLAFQASHDALTGLVNRAEFERRLERLLASARHDGGSHALCYLDLDQFKVVNDTCGHMAGDALLERLAETLTFRVRQRDTVARLGGDEFAVLIEHCSLEQATRVASALHQAIGEFAFTWDDKQFQIGASIGLVPITPDLGNATDVLSAADSACYVAKDQGRNRIHVYAKDDVELTRRRGEMNWVSHISGALAQDRFRLRSQPVVPLSPRQAGAHHCELLVVMLDRDGNDIAPGAFLPAAERYTLATRIDRWVVRAALRWLADDSDGRGRPALTGINLSAQSLVESDFLAYIRGECEEHGVPASRLCFEITETAAIANLETAQRFMHELRRDGARFALDDFGKGLSSFGHLRALPVDYIKIDAQFVRDLTTDPIDRAMVRSINEVAHLMRKLTIAEGVESHEVLQVLREVGVDYAQGFAVGMPRFI